MYKSEHENGYIYYTVQVEGENSWEEWDNGSCDYAEAREMAEAEAADHPDRVVQIAVIDVNDHDNFCVDVIEVQNPDD